MSRFPLTKTIRSAVRGNFHSKSAEVSDEFDLEALENAQSVAENDLTKISEEFPAVAENSLTKLAEAFLTLAENSHTNRLTNISERISDGR